MPTHQGALPNHLLMALPADEHRRLSAHLEPVQLQLIEVIYESGGELRHVYFPTTAIVSLLYLMENGASAEIAVVGNDAAWAQIAREQVKLLRDDVGTVLARTAYHEVARGFGAEGIEIRRPDEVEPGLQRAREIATAGRPVLVNVWLDKTDFRDGSISM